MMLLDVADAEVRDRCPASDFVSLLEADVMPDANEQVPRILDLPIGLNATGMRQEFDSLGRVEVPANRYWGGADPAQPPAGRPGGPDRLG